MKLLGLLRKKWRWLRQVLAGRGGLLERLQEIC
jgi:hypothetical protein